MGFRSVRTTGVGEGAKKALNSHRAPHIIKNTATISPSYQDGTAVATMATGKYTYLFFKLCIRSAVEIAGDTLLKHGVHYVKSSKLAKYVDRIRLEIDGRVERDLPTDKYVAFQELRKQDVSDGDLFMIFGGPDQFADRRVEDAYMLGTKDVESLRILFDLTSEWVDGQMHLEVMSEYAPIARNTHFLRTLKSYRFNATAEGLFTITGLPIHADIGAYYVLGDGILSGTIIVDDVDVISGTAADIEAINKLYGQDVEALGNGMVFDFLRTKEIGKGLKALETKSQRKRNADIRIDVDMAAAAEIVVVVEQIGTLRSQS